MSHGSILYAKDKNTGRCVSAAVATREHTHICYGCEGNLILKRGEVLTPHFSHTPDRTGVCAGGGLETWQHEEAKYLLADHLNKWTLQSTCDRCCYQQPYQLKLARGEAEKSFGRYRVDVMAMVNGRVFLPIEVRHTHPVDDKKRKAFAKEGLNVVEVTATAVIEAWHQKQWHVSCDSRCLKHFNKPCLQCQKWFLEEELREILPPKNHPFAKAFVCASCIAHCPLCSLESTEALQNYDLCYNCWNEKEDWIAEAEQVDVRDYRKMRELIDCVPPSVDHSKLMKFLMIEYQALKGKAQRDRKLRKEEEQRQKMEERRREEERRKQEEKEEKLKKEQEQRARVASEQEEKRKEDQAKRRDEHSRNLQSRAEEIIRKDRVYYFASVRLPHARKEGDMWYLPANKIQLCKDKLDDGERLATMVKSRLKEKQQRRKKKHDTLNTKHYKPINQYFPVKNSEITK